MPSVASPVRDVRWLALSVLCAGMLMVVLDQTIVNVALPSIQSDLGFSEAGLAWVVNGYLIAFAGLLLLAGRLGDFVGHKTVFLTGVAVFSVASLLCGLAESRSALVAARFVQGLGGATASSVILGVIATMFPEPRDQARAIGVYSFVASAGASVGLLLGGVITQAINWHWIFFVNVPIGAVTALLAWRLLDDDRGTGFHGSADMLGALLIVLTLMLAVYAIIGASDHGWISIRTVALAASAGSLLAAFVVRESRARQPLVPLQIFRTGDTSAANLIQALMVAGMFGMFFLGALYLQRVLAYSAVDVGLAFLPVALLIGIFSLRVSAPLAMRYGPRAVVVVGLSVIGVGLLLLEQAPVRAEYWRDILPAMLLLGTGAGLGLPAVVTLAMSAADPREAGLASGLANTTLQVGGALGLALMTTLSSDRSQALLRRAADADSALTGGYHLALLTGAGLIATALVIALALLRAEPVVAADARRHGRSIRSDNKVGRASAPEAQKE